MFYYLSAKFIHFINYFVNTSEIDKRINDLEVLIIELKNELNIIKIQLEKKHIIDTVKTDFFSRMRNMFPVSNHHHHLYFASGKTCTSTKCDIEPLLQLP